MSQSRQDINRRIGDPEFDGSFQSKPAKDPMDVARHILRRERMWLRVLTVATCLTWVAATAAGIALAHFYFDRQARQMALLEYRMAKTHEETFEGQEPAEISQDQKRSYSNDRRNIGRVYDVLMLWTQAAITLAGVAALLSVWLVIASRRVSLKQINVSLASLSENLESLLKTHGTEELRSS